MELALILEAMMNRPVQTDLGMEEMEDLEVQARLVITGILEVPMEVMGGVILLVLGLEREGQAKGQPLGSLGNLLEICILVAVAVAESIAKERAAPEVAGILGQEILPQLLGPQIRAVVEVVAEVMDITILLLVADLELQSSETPVLE